MKTRIPPVLIALTLVCFALSPQARAVCQEGCDLTNSNTFLGNDALLNNTTGSDNTAIGNNALVDNTTGDLNTAIGPSALHSNTTANANTAIGHLALQLNTTGSNNTGTGAEALNHNTIGSGNTAMGLLALVSNTIGNSNTATGDSALSANATGSNNAAYGTNALFDLLSGNNNIAFGSGAGDHLKRGNSNIFIGNEGVAVQSNTIRIGAVQTQTSTYIAGIANAMVTGSPVYIDTTSGQLGLLSSSERFKDGIEPMNNASEALFSLRPVTFRYKKNIDPKGAPQFGLVAEEVQKVNPALVARDGEGKAFTVRYEAVNAMLLNEFLKEHRKNEEQQEQINVLTAQLREQAAQIQKVSAQLEASKPAPQVVNNP